MADQNVAALLAALTGGAQQQRASGAPGQTPLPPGYGLPGNLGGAPPSGVPTISSPPPTGFALPQPSSSGSLDLSQIKPTASGRVSLDDALAKVKARAAELGARPSESGRYDDTRSRYGRSGRSRSRSRSPPRRGGDPFRDAYSTFRDERRGRNSDYSRDRSFSPPATRGRYSPPPRYGGAGGGTGSVTGGTTTTGSHRQRSPAPELDQLNIDASLVGLIIGRGGENLRRVESETGARVQFMTNGHDRDAGGERVCNIQGTRQQVNAARREIERIIAENDKTGGGAGGARARQPQFAGANAAPLGVPGAAAGIGAALTGGRGAGTGGGSDSGKGGASSRESTQIFVPDRTVGLIIGRGGETIRDIQDKSGCHVNIVGEAKSQNGQRPVNLIGSPQASEYAKRLIMEIVESDTNGGPPGPPMRSNDRAAGGAYGGYGDAAGAAGGPRITEVMRVPIEAVGMIIGKGGETIKEMQASTGCRINVSSQSNPTDGEREINLAGTRDAIARARAVIEEKVEASLNKSRGGGNDRRPGGAGGYGAGGGGGGGDRSGSAWQDYSSAQQQQQQGGGGGGGGGAGGAAGGAGAEDPYAAYGGYQAYCAMYYAAVMQQQQQQQGGGAQPPGT